MRESMLWPFLAQEYQAILQNPSSFASSRWLVIAFPSSFAVHEGDAITALSLQPSSGYTSL